MRMAPPWLSEHTDEVRGYLADYVDKRATNYALDAGVTVVGIQRRGRGRTAGAGSGVIAVDVMQRRIDPGGGSVNIRDKREIINNNDMYIYGSFSHHLTITPQISPAVLLLLSVLHHHHPYGPYTSPSRSHSSTQVEIQPSIVPAEHSPIDNRGASMAFVANDKTRPSHSIRNIPVPSSLESPADRIIGGTFRLCNITVKVAAGAHIACMYLFFSLCLTTRLCLWGGRSCCAVRLFHHIFCVHLWEYRGTYEP